MATQLTGHSWTRWPTSTSSTPARRRAMRRGRSCGFPRSAVRFLLCSLGMAALPSGALVLARGVGVHNESLADFWLGRVGDAAGEVELLKGEVSRLRAEQQWLAISRIPRMPAAEGFSWLDGQNGQVSDHQRRGEAPQYPRLLHPVACAAPRAWTCGSRTCSSCSLTAILSLLPSPIFAVLAACGEAPLRLRLYPCGPPALRHAPLASGQCWRHMM